MSVINKLPINNNEQSNISAFFAQPTEPDAKRGIWIKTDKTDKTYNVISTYDTYYLACNIIENIEFLGSLDGDPDYLYYYNYSDSYIYKYNIDNNTKTAIFGECNNYISNTGKEIIIKLPEDVVIINSDGVKSYGYNDYYIDGDDFFIINNEIYTLYLTYGGDTDCYLYFNFYKANINGGEIVSSTLVKQFSEFFCSSEFYGDSLTRPAFYHYNGILYILIGTGFRPINGDLTGGLSATVYMFNSSFYLQSKSTLPYHGFSNLLLYNNKLLCFNSNDLYSINNGTATEIVSNLFYSYSCSYYSDLMFKYKDKLYIAKNNISSTIRLYSIPDPYTIITYVLDTGDRNYGTINVNNEDFYNYTIGSYFGETWYENKDQQPIYLRTNQDTKWEQCYFEVLPQI